MLRRVAGCFDVLRIVGAKMRKLGRVIVNFAAAACVLIVLLYLFAAFFRPDVTTGPPTYSDAEIAEIERSRDTSFEPDDAPVLHREVDYDELESAAWRPGGEASFLAELVQEGRLPAVEERVGEQPAVIEGVDGIGHHGGTWYRVASSEGDVSTITWRVGGATLLRWSPLGYPLKPHMARDWEVSDDRREYIVHLRRGIRWSDGHPFTADDILYWWEHEVEHFDQRPQSMLIGGELGDIEKIDRYTVRFTFPSPNGTFPERLAKFTLWAPAHYLRPFHPEVGDPEKIEAMKRVQGAATARSAYFRLKHFRNPEHPRMWPWVPRVHQTTPPYEFVRNPYFWAVDPAGNQLPYLDRVLFDIRSLDMLPVTAAAGDITMQLRHIRYDDYTLYMDHRVERGYDVYHWLQGTRSAFAIFPNLNRRVDPDRPESEWKHRLLNEKTFRQAMSLAINRAEIIAADYNDQTEPAQLDPGPESPFHHPRLFKSFTEHDTERANALLDDLGLDQRDVEGFRTFPDGSPMTFYLHVTDYTGTGPSPFLIEHWAEVGVRVVLQERARSLWERQRAAFEHDFSVWMGESEAFPLIEPRSFVPTSIGSMYAPGFALWYAAGGLHGLPEEHEGRPRVVEPPEDHPLRRAMVALGRAQAETELEQQREQFNEVLDIAAEHTWTINISTPPPQLVIVDNQLHNVPRNAVVGHIFNTPANAGPETYFLETPRDSPGAVAQMKRAVAQVQPDPNLTLEAVRQDEGRGVGEVLAFVVRILVWGIVLLGGGLVAVRHPFVARRVLILIPTLLVVSVGTFLIIQLPPGSFLEARIAELEMAGDADAIREIEELKTVFHMDEPIAMRYVRWLGLPWFVSFDSGDMGLLQGDLGRSMEGAQRVNDVVGDRVLLTCAISALTILFTWALAIPIGIYSAVRQYSIGDYVFTLVGFIGMCIPNFLLALILMHLSSILFDAPVSGLFSPEYASQPEWTWGKAVDLFKHIWVPVLVLGTAGTASMIRVMRGNLLDELRKPYVVTARAKGVRPMKLLLKYPVRIALNPFISGIGGIFPQLVSGGAIVAIVLSLPTVGPMLLNALMAQDMYLAGSMLMVLSLLTVFGTLVSDLLLMWLDPRIRMSGGTR